MIIDGRHGQVVGNVHLPGARSIPFCHFWVAVELLLLSARFESEFRLFVLPPSQYHFQDSETGSSVVVTMLKNIPSRKHPNKA